MIESMSSPLLAHLWQSTLVIGVVWLATLALRPNRARVRYWLWTAGSMKFLVPFVWLVSLGAQFEWKTAPPITQPAAAFVMDQILAPPVVATLTMLTPTTQPTAFAGHWGPSVLTSIWATGFFGVVFWWWRQWRPIGSALRQATPLELGPEHELADIAVMSSPSTFEPGVVGIWRPILLLPEGLVDRLTTAQLNAVIAHERCHVRCHDNLVAALHMLVEALFWFHPMVWFIERRLIDERERACDEAVLGAGNDPAEYAEGILTVCRLTVHAPLACVTGVAGSNLRARIESIVRRELGTRMTLYRRAAIALVAVALIGVPIAVGVVKTEAPLIAVGQESGTPVVFEAAAIRQNTSGERMQQTQSPPGGRFVATNATLKLLIEYAYQIRPNQLVDAPDWIGTDHFDVNAKLEREAPRVPGEVHERELAVQSLLAERFKLEVHREVREVPMYALVMARTDRKPGPMLKPSSTDCSPAAREALRTAADAGKPIGTPGTCGTRVNTGRIQFGGYPLSQFARAFSYDDRSVIDRTGLDGNWEFVLTFRPDPLPAPRPGQEPPPFDPDGPSLPAANAGTARPEAGVDSRSDGSAGGRSC